MCSYIKLQKLLEIRHQWWQALNISDAIPVFRPIDKNRLMAPDLRDAKFARNKLCSGPTFEKHFSLIHFSARVYEIHVFTVPSDRKPHLVIHEGNLQV
ncbi:hypothetical protein SADUNF_Sadunf16G0246700 [Salix dunnii]|uniref:Uncharacterized protein n=1 Tax=Salix dunnii TaxID=1413687 RepID=A0A835JG65_9ROSI|nr:hypothetical protein SADUNF_Sadunf16G0246700 [Salix dunnii]